MVFTTGFPVSRFSLKSATIFIFFLLPALALAHPVADNPETCPVCGQPWPETMTPLQRNAAAIAYEASLPTSGTLGRPLPLASSWCANQSDSRWHLAAQLGWIEQGHKIMPWAVLPDFKFRAEWMDLYFNDAFTTAAQLRLPMTLRTNEIERSARFITVPLTETPLTLTEAGASVPYSPFGSSDAWHQAGARAAAGYDMAQTPRMVELRDRYPNPSRLLFVSNNEIARLSPTQFAYDTRFDGIDPTGTAYRLWPQCYRAFVDGVHAGLPDAWNTVLRVVAYGGSGNVAPGWESWTWDGSSPSRYLTGGATDVRADSPQMVSMAGMPFVERRLQQDAGYWNEFSVWDGEASYLALKFPEGYSPERYAGWIQFCMWIERPRAVREFRGSTAKYEGRNVDYWSAVMGSVDRVWAHETLREFWRESELVQTSGINYWYRPEQNNFMRQNVDPSISAMYLLPCVDNTGTFSYSSKTTPVPVWSLARKRGENYLVYAYAPQGDRATTVTIPDHGDVQLTATVGGAFYLIPGGSVTRVD